MSSKRNVVVIGASAGGMETLVRLLRNISNDISASIFIVQHVGRNSILQFDHILDQAGPLPVSFGKDGERFKPGHVYLAPPDHHLLISKQSIRITHGPRENRSRPAIDPLFRSAAVFHGTRAIGVVLTGTLDDGTAGLLAIKRCGGIAVVQDPSDALFSEMPDSALEYVNVDYSVDLDSMPDLLLRLSEEQAGPPVTPPNDLVREAMMAEAESGDQPDTEALGHLSSFVCPECNGPLWRIDAESHERYRCHTGHAFTARALNDELMDVTERALWVALQNLESRIRMLERLAKDQRNLGRNYSGSMFADQANELRDHSQIIRNLLQQSDSTNAATDS